MIIIVGFAEAVLLEKGLTTRKEMRVRTPDGVEHGVEIPEDVMQKLLAIFAGSQKSGVTPIQRKAQPAPPPAPPEPDPEPDPAPEVGEVTFGGDLPEPSEPTPPAAPQVVRPRFLDADEDGKQI